MRWKSANSAERHNEKQCGFWLCSVTKLCVWITAVFMCALHVVYVFTLEDYMFLCTWRMGQVFMLTVTLLFVSLPHHHPQQTKRSSVYPQQSAAFQQHRATLRHIYISIHRGLTAFNSTSLRQSFTGWAIHDGLCTEYELWIMQHIHKHQGYSWVKSD